MNFVNQELILISIFVNQLDLFMEQTHAINMSIIFSFIDILLIMQASPVIPDHLE